MRGLLKYSTVLIALSLLPSAPARSQQSAPPAPPTPTSDAPSPQAGTSTPYPDTADGLRQLLTDVLAAARSGDHEKLAGMVKDMDIPNYENWFEAAYGAGGGATRAKTYGARLDQNDVNFENKFVGLSQQNGDILTQSTNASPLADVAVKWGMVDSVKQSLDVYVATWRPAEGADPSTTIPIGFFMFIEGKFRWNS